MLREPAAIATPERYGIIITTRIQSTILTEPKRIWDLCICQLVTSKPHSEPSPDVFSPLAEMLAIPLVCNIYLRIVFEMIFFQPSNAISSLVVNQLVKDENNEHVSVNFHRRIPDVVKGFRTLKRSVLPDGPPPRLPSTLPPPGNLELSLSVDDLIGEGRCGTVFSTYLSLLLDPSNEPVEVLEPYLPSLVIKVADQAHIEDLATEASMYEEMENLQGVAIPRYYGWFEAELEPAWTVDSRSGENEAPTSTHSGRLSLLLLERMGPLLPIGERLPDRYVANPSFT